MRRGRRITCWGCTAARGTVDLLGDRPFVGHQPEVTVAFGAVEAPLVCEPTTDGEVLLDSAARTDPMDLGQGHVFPRRPDTEDQTCGNLRAMQEHLHQADIQTTTIYTRLAPQDLQRVVNLFDQNGGATN